VVAVAVGDERVEGVVSTKLLASLPAILTLNCPSPPAPTVDVVVMVTVLVGSAASLLKIDKSPLRLSGVGVVATTKGEDVSRVVIVSAPIVVVSSFSAPFIWLEAIVDFVASTVPPISSVGPSFPMDVVQGAGSAGCCLCDDCSD
jgi:hypothetical protein